MNIMQFKCSLLSDVILSVKAASEGNQNTLDFIPGNNFLGIVASQLYQDGSKESMMIFHSGKVKFGDAHCAKNGVRSFKIPLAFYYPKLKKKEEECYVIHKVKNLFSSEMLSKQLKQCRTVFYCFSDLKILEVPLQKTFAIKSAYDKNYRRSYDEKIYGYESLSKGTEFYFDVTFDDIDEDIQLKIKNALIGIRRVGRSKTAQYGLVKIEECSFDNNISSFPVSVKAGNYVEVYADSRLIFMDQYGMPTFQPTVADLGIPNGKICWDLSQIRTFQYSPWNSKRQTYDADRCGIEKGSVIIVKTSDDLSLEPSAFVGFYQNEGFGRVIYNPDFLQANSDGRAKYNFINSADCVIPFCTSDVSAADDSQGLFTYLQKRKDIERQRFHIYMAVNNFVNTNRCYFEGTAFASQWGVIRSIALKYPSSEVRNEIERYISHGIKEKDWSVKCRKNKLLDFLDQREKEIDIRELVINLASEMAKTCK